jgi:hypothetical protein
MSAANPESYRERKGFMERANLKNRKAIFEICSLLLSFWRRSCRCQNDKKADATDQVKGKISASFFGYAKKFLKDYFRSYESTLENRPVF